MKNSEVKEIREFLDDVIREVSLKDFQKKFDNFFNVYLIKYKGDVIKNNVFEKGYAHGSITIPIDKAEITKISEIFISELRDSVDTYNKNEDFIFSLINTNKIEDLIRDFCRLRCIGCTIIPYKGNMLIELRL